MPSTFRADIVSGLKTILDEFQTAHGDLLRATFRTRPESFDKDTPFAFIERWSEDIHHDSGTRERLTAPTIVVVDRLTTNDETLARFDTLIDLLVDHFTSHPNVAPVTIWDDMRVEDAFEDGFWTTRFTFSDLTIQEGRA
jgi:hypothetical protein